jgi:hypothetical protein
MGRKEEGRKRSVWGGVEYMRSHRWNEKQWDLFGRCFHSITNLMDLPQADLALLSQGLNTAREERAEECAGCP